MAVLFKKMKARHAIIILLVVSLFFTVGYGVEQNCDTSNLVNEYSAGFSNNSLKINFNDKLYEITKYQNNRYLPIDPNNCTLVLDKQISKELINAYLYLQNPNLNNFLETYRTLKGCHSIAIIAKPVCSATNAITNFLDSATAQAVTHSGNAIPDMAAKLAPYGWKMDSRVVANGAVKLVKKGNEIQIAIEVAEYASCELSSSVVAKVYDYSNLAYSVGTESNSGKFYFNSVNVLSGVNDELLNYLETSNQKFDFLDKLNGRVANILNHECSAIDDRPGKIYSNITDASTFYKSLESQSIDISDAYIGWIDKIKSEAAESMNNLKNHPKGGESNTVYLDATKDYDHGLYIRAKMKSDAEIAQLNRPVTIPTELEPPQDNNWLNKLLAILMSFLHSVFRP